MKTSQKNKVRKFIQNGLDARTSIELVQNEENREQLRISNRFNKSENHLIKFDGTQIQ